jgi:hypothetical protein
MQSLSIEGFRLSPQQKRLWLLQQAGHSQPYRAQCAVLIEGNLNTDTLESAIQKVVERHEILRTNFQDLPGMNLPLQVIADNSLLAIRHHNIRDLSPEEQEAKIEVLFHEASQLAFDFECGSVLDVSLVILSPDKHLLLACLPAMNADLVTLRNLVGEISRSYAASLHNQELIDEPLQYIDIAEWQNELFEGEEAELGKEYWRTKDLSGLATWKLPQENPSVVKLGFEPKSISLTFNSDRVAKLEAIAQKYDTSISTLLQACWHVLLWRLTGQSDVIVGTYCDGRNYEELEPALGLLAKYLPINCHLEDNFKFCGILKQIDESIGNAFKWQEAFTWEELAGTTAKRPRFIVFPVLL